MQEREKNTLSRIAGEGGERSEPGEGRDRTIMNAGIRIAVDIGGTFTDLQLVDEATGWIGAYKLPTTPEDPSIGLLEGIRGACVRHGLDIGRVGVVMHGTTIATNAVLERRLPQGALITTAGFEGGLGIGPHAPPRLYRPPAQAPPPPIP